MGLQIYSTTLEEIVHQTVYSHHSLFKSASTGVIFITDPIRNDNNVI